jgi:hypothetical protein
MLTSLSLGVQHLPATRTLVRTICSRTQTYTCWNHLVAGVGSSKQHRLLATFSTQITRDQLGHIHVKWLLKLIELIYVDAWLFRSHRAQQVERWTPGVRRDVTSCPIRAQDNVQTSIGNTNYTYLSESYTYPRNADRVHVPITNKTTNQLPIVLCYLANIPRCHDLPASLAGMGLHCGCHDNILLL